MASRAECLLLCLRLRHFFLFSGVAEVALTTPHPDSFHCGRARPDVTCQSVGVGRSGCRPRRRFTLLPPHSSTPSVAGGVRVQPERPERLSHPCMVISMKPETLRGGAIEEIASFTRCLVAALHWFHFALCHVLDGLNKCDVTPD